MNPCNYVTFKCSKCGSLRKESNGWFVITVYEPDAGGRVVAFRSVTVRKMQHDEPPLPDGMEAACSASCLYPLIQDNLG